jgi:hypothetical protein
MHSSITQIGSKRDIDLSEVRFPVRGTGIPEAIAGVGREIHRSRL